MFRADVLSRERNENEITMEPPTRVLVINDEPSSAKQLTDFLASSGYEARACSGIAETRDDASGGRPHVLVLVPSRDTERHDQLECLRRLWPRIPVVVVTKDQSPDVLLDIEAFAPALTARPEGGHIASTVAAAIA